MVIFTNFIIIESENGYYFMGFEILFVLNLSYHIKSFVIPNLDFQIKSEIFIEITMKHVGEYDNNFVTIA